MTSVAVLEAEYGADRDYLQVGGYSLLFDSADDLAQFKSIIDYDTHPCEWALRESRNSGYLSALYIMNNDFSIMVFMPLAVAPTAILADLED